MDSFWRIHTASGFFVAGLVIGLVRITFGQNTTGVCYSSESVDIDFEWVKTAGKNGFYIPIHSTCKNCELDKTWEPEEQISKKMICWDTDFVPAGKDSSAMEKIPFHCEYKEIKLQSCSWDTSSMEDSDSKIGLKGLHKYIKTDNSTYFVSTICVYGKEKFWFISSINEKLDPTLQTELLNELQTLGFETKETVSRDSKDHFKMSKIKISIC